MIFSVYTGLFRVLLVLIGIAIAVSIIYAVIVHGGEPLIEAQTGGYESLIESSTEEILHIIDTGGVFDI